MHADVWLESARAQVDKVLGMLRPGLVAEIDARRHFLHRGAKESGVNPGRASWQFGFAQGAAEAIRLLTEPSNASMRQVIAMVDDPEISAETLDNNVAGLVATTWALGIPPNP